MSEELTLAEMREDLQRRCDDSYATVVYGIHAEAVVVEWGEDNEQPSTPACASYAPLPRVFIRGQWVERARPYSDVQWTRRLRERRAAAKAARKARRRNR